MACVALQVICGDTVEPKHWSDVDSRQLLDIVKQLLTNTFASADCVDLLKGHEAWLRICAEEVQIQMLSTVRLLRSKVELNFSLKLDLEGSVDPVTIMFLESQRKAFQMLVDLAPVDNASSDCPSPSRNITTGASTAPASPSPFKVSRPCTIDSCCIHVTH